MRHEQTIIYQRCLEWMEVARELIEQLPSGFGFLADQLRRNTASVAHNFGEGYYQQSQAQKRRYLGYARHSAREASTSFDTATCFRAGSAQTIARGKRLTLELVKLLSSLAR
jgi:four helix bundle protein